MPLWKSLPAAALNDRRVTLPNSPKSRTVLRLALMVLLIAALFLGTGLKMWTNGSLTSQAIVRIQFWNLDLKPTLRSGTTICPCAQQAIPWNRIAHWKGEVKDYWAVWRKNSTITQGDFNYESAFALQQCRSLVKGETKVVNELMVLSLALCLAANSTENCTRAYRLDSSSIQLCYTFLVLYAHQLNSLPGQEQRTFSSAYLVADDVLRSALHEFTGKTLVPRRHTPVVYINSMPGAMLINNHTF